MPSDPLPGHPAESVSPPTILYIAGYGRSGSTVLDIALSSHPRIEGFGELAGLFEELADGRIGDDPFWARFPVTACKEANRLAARAERLLPGRAMIPGSSLRRRYVALQQMVLGELAERSGADVLIDSSKSSQTHTWRLPLLTCVAPDTRCLILVRDLEGVVSSVRRGRGDTQAAQRLPTIRAVLGWTLANVTAVATGLASCGRHRTRVVRYERFAAQPGPTLDAIVAWAGLEPSPDTADGLANGFRPRHQLQGNRVRQRPLIRIEPPPAGGGRLGGAAGAIATAVAHLVDRLALGLVAELRPRDETTADRHQPDEPAKPAKPAEPAGPG